MTVCTYDGVCGFTKAQIESFQKGFQQLAESIKEIGERIRSILEGLGEFTSNKDHKPTYFERVKVLKTQVIDNRPRMKVARSNC